MSWMKTEFCPCCGAAVYRWRCPACGREGESDGRALTCPGRAEVTLPDG